MKEAYAVATVVQRKAPVSSHLGDKALIFENGRMEGFIGGACSREIVRRQALQAMRAGAPRLIKIRPDAGEAIDEGDVVTVPMTCLSEGAVDVYVEPHFPRRSLLIAGFTPVADALSRLAPALDFEVVRFVDEGELRDLEPVSAANFPIKVLEDFLGKLEPENRQRAVAIAASQGHYDEEALLAFLKHGIGFVGLLASTKRAASIGWLLVKEGVSRELVGTIHNPVGLAIGARKPAEVAVSILAEVISCARAPVVADAAVDASGETASDPVCGMPVEISSSRYIAEVSGHSYYFCSATCRANFLDRPNQFLTAASS